MGKASRIQLIHNWSLYSRWQSVLKESVTSYFYSITILLNLGSIGNSAILLPSLVNSPSLPRAPSAYNNSRALISVSAGGASMKSKWMRSWMSEMWADWLKITIKDQRVTTAITATVILIPVQVFVGRSEASRSHPKPSMTERRCLDWIVRFQEYSSRLALSRKTIWCIGESICLKQ